MLSSARPFGVGKNLGSLWSQTSDWMPGRHRPRLPVSGVEVWTSVKSESLDLGFNMTASVCSIGFAGLPRKIR